MPTKTPHHCPSLPQCQAGPHGASQSTGPVQAWPNHPHQQSGAAVTSGPPRPMGGRSSLGPPTTTVTMDESTGLPEEGRGLPRKAHLGSHLGPLPRSIQRPRSKAQRCYSLARDLRQKAELPGLADPGGRGAGGGEGQGPTAVPATRGINGLITHPIKSRCDLESLPVRPWNSGTCS